MVKYSSETLGKTFRHRFTALNVCYYVRSADAYRFFPDDAEINVYDSNWKLLDSREVTLSPESGIQTFGLEDYDRSHISTSSSGASGYYTGTSDSYIGNLETHKFHTPCCGDVDKMDNANKISFSTRDEAVSCGYSSCGHCNP